MTKNVESEKDKQNKLAQEKKNLEENILNLELLNIKNEESKLNKFD